MDINRVKNIVEYLNLWAFERGCEDIIFGYTYMQYVITIDAYLSGGELNLYNSEGDSLDEYASDEDLAFYLTYVLRGHFHVLQSFIYGEKN